MRMRIIDCNAAIGPPEARDAGTNPDRFRDAAGLLHWLDDFHIEAAWTYHRRAMMQPAYGNGLLMAAAGPRLRPCVTLNPSLMALSLPGEGTMEERLRALRPAAARLFPENQHYVFDSFYAGEMLEVLERLRLPVLVDCPYDALFLHNLPQVAADFPKLPIVLLRFGQNQSRSIFPLMARRENVYFDISVMLDTGQLEELTARWGSERLLFGSGLPVYEPSGALGLLLYAGIGDAHRENIAYRNITRLEAEIRYDA